jgi:hypothetical protein
MAVAGGSAAPKALIPDHGHRTIYLGAFERYFMSAVVATAFGWISVYSFISGELVVGGVYAIIGGVTVWIAVFRIAVRIEPTTLIIRNPLRTRVVEIADLIGAVPAYAGLQLTVRGGKRITVVAVQRHNLAIALRRQTRADRLGEELLARARELRSPGISSTT